MVASKTAPLVTTLYLKDNTAPSAGAIRIAGDIVKVESVPDKAVAELIVCTTEEPAIVHLNLCQFDLLHLLLPRLTQKRHLLWD